MITGTFFRAHPVASALMVLISFLVFVTSVYHVGSFTTVNLESLKKLSNLKGIRRPTFLEIARKHGTDKVSPHSYHNMYQKYLEPLRDQRVKMLEIGLGCDMGYGPGASYYTWLEFFPHVDLYYIEFDGACAEKWAASTTGATIFSGDQADVPFLKKFIEESGGDFDIIVDDGGHTMLQQLTSFDTLFPILNPGGIYFCEDLQTSYIPAYGGGPSIPGTMMERIKGSLDELITSASKHDVMLYIWSIDCMREICAFSKKGLMGEY